MIYTVALLAIALPPTFPVWCHTCQARHGIEDAIGTPPTGCWFPSFESPVATRG